MIRHYLRLIWNRKRTNLLGDVEIFFSFLVVFARRRDARAYYANNYRRPLGFAIDDVWAVNVDTKLRSALGRATDEAADARVETMRQLDLARAGVPGGRGRGRRLHRAVRRIALDRARRKVNGRERRLRRSTR